MKKEISLSNQLILISLIVFLILTVSLTIFLPKALSPYFEETVYTFLNQPLKYFSNSITENYFNENIVYIQINNSGNMIISENAKKVFKTEDYNRIINKIKYKNGKFKIKTRNYYYVTTVNKDTTKITITDEKFVNGMKNRIFVSILPIIIITFLLILIALLIWCNFLIHKIYLLKNKVKNIKDENYDHTPKIRLEDELKMLEDTIESVRLVMLEQENFKNEMYQNISHDFKTPISVIKSYIEANRDGVINNDETRNVVSEQINKLDNKVKSLLELNKLEYLKDHYSNTDGEINIVEIVNKSVQKFKLENKNIRWKIICKRGKIIYKGTQDMWESILDNLFGNFMRYAKKNITVEILQKKLILFNDGESIDENIISNIFSPYKKGMKGQFGLGLSIVQKTCKILGYEVKVENVKNGVKFIIEK
ncbi:MAG: HAMP domain-containing histidine kinase [Bacilli bacterium]|nr:HAMP domain-containing histidine kinase [Bacilli bacterium]